MRREDVGGNQLLEIELERAFALVHPTQDMCHARLRLDLERLLAVLLAALLPARLQVHLAAALAQLVAQDLHPLVALLLGRLAQLALAPRVLFGLLRPEAVGVLEPLAAVARSIGRALDAALVRLALRQLGPQLGRLDARVARVVREVGGVCARVGRQVAHEPHALPAEAVVAPGTLDRIALEERVLLQPARLLDRHVLHLKVLRPLLLLLLLLKLALASARRLGQRVQLHAVDAQRAVRVERAQVDVSAVGQLGVALGESQRYLVANQAARLHRRRARAVERQRARHPYLEPPRLVVADHSRLVRLVRAVVLRQHAPGLARLAVAVALVDRPGVLERARKVGRVGVVVAAQIGAVLGRLAVRDPRQRARRRVAGVVEARLERAVAARVCGLGVRSAPPRRDRRVCRQHAEPPVVQGARAPQAVAVLAPVPRHAEPVGLAAQAARRDVFLAVHHDALEHLCRRKPHLGSGDVQAAPTVGTLVQPPSLQLVAALVVVGRPTLDHGVDVHAPIVPCVFAFRVDARDGSAASTLQAVAHRRGRVVEVRMRVRRDGKRLNVAGAGVGRREAVQLRKRRKLEP